MWSWLAPFVVTAVIGALYASGRRLVIQQNANFIMVCILATSVISIIANARMGTDSMDYLTWGVAAVATALAIWKIFTDKPGSPGPEDRGPL